MGQAVALDVLRAGQRGAADSRLLAAISLIPGPLFGPTQGDEGGVLIGLTAALGLRGSWGSGSMLRRSASSDPSQQAGDTRLTGFFPFEQMRQMHRAVVLVPPVIIAGGIHALQRGEVGHQFHCQQAACCGQLPRSGRSVIGAAKQTLNQGHHRFRRQWLVLCLGGAGLRWPAGTGGLTAC